MSTPGLSLRRLPNGTPVIRVHYSADPTMTPARLAALRGQYTRDAMWRREMEIEYEALEGERLFPEYNPQYNDIEPFDVSDPSKWTLWMACDPHGRTPNMFLWLAVDKHGDWRVCGELFAENPEGHGLRAHASEQSCVDAIEWIESDSEVKPMAFSWSNGKWLHIHYRVMDTHGSAINSESGGHDFFRTFSEMGLHFYPAHKGEQINQVARDTISHMLTPVKIVVGDREWMEPRCRIFRGCAELRSQLENCRYPEGEIEKPSDEKPATYKRHAVDCLTYIASETPRFVPRHSTISRFAPANPAIGY